MNELYTIPGIRKASMVLLISAIILLSACSTTEQRTASTPFDAFKQLGDPAIMGDKQAFMKHLYDAITSISSRSNRRSHDKLIIKDGSFPGKDMVMTGGRNISIDYYGISKDGTRNPDTSRQIYAIV